MKLSVAYVQRAWVPPTAAAALLGTTRSWVSDTARELGLEKEWHEYDGSQQLCYPLAPLHGYIEAHGYTGKMEFCTTRQVADHFQIALMTAYAALVNVRPRKTRIFHRGWTRIYLTGRVLAALEPRYPPLVDGHTATRLGLLIGRDERWVKSRVPGIGTVPVPSRCPENGNGADIYELDTEERLRIISQQERTIPPAGDWVTRRAVVGLIPGKTKYWCYQTMARPEILALSERRRDDMGNVRLHWPPEVVDLLKALAAQEAEAASDSDHSHTG
ncbi:MAG TPA: hypothetical protein VMT30_03520 [Candidatus Saccharimonadia bacterium]|nr:hypothetical protein [Candidatus Saccharimonadia bacterium]